MKKEAFKKDIKEIIKTMTFVEALKYGLVDYNDIDHFVDTWHEGDSTLEIDEFLGMTEEQYFKWVDEGNEILSQMFTKGSEK